MAVVKERKEEGKEEGEEEGGVAGMMDDLTRMQEVRAKVALFLDIMPELTVEDAVMLAAIYTSKVIDDGRDDWVLSHILMAMVETYTGRDLLLPETSDEVTLDRIGRFFSKWEEVFGDEGIPLMALYILLEKKVSAPGLCDSIASIFGSVGRCVDDLAGGEID